MTLTLKDTQHGKIIDDLNSPVVKYYHGSLARARFKNEVRVLRHLNEQGCPFVPRLFEFNDSNLSIEIEYCGHNVEYLPQERLPRIFEGLLEFGVRHVNPVTENILFNPLTGCFSVINFEFAEIFNQNKDVGATVLEKGIDAIELLIGQEVQTFVKV